MLEGQARARIGGEGSRMTPLAMDTEEPRCVSARRGSLAFLDRPGSRPHLGTLPERRAEETQAARPERAGPAAEGQPRFRARVQNGPGACGPGPSSFCRSAAEGVMNGLASPTGLQPVSVLGTPSERRSYGCGASALASTTGAGGVSSSQATPFQWRCCPVS